MVSNKGAVTAVLPISPAGMQEWLVQQVGRNISHMGDWRAPPRESILQVAESIRNISAKALKESKSIYTKAGGIDVTI